MSERMWVRISYGLRFYGSCNAMRYGNKAQALLLFSVRESGKTVAR
jgi:hypothetical protein